MSIRRSKRAIDKRFKEAGNYYLERFPARLGNYAHVVNVPGKNGMVYARLETSGQVIEAINYLAPAIFDLPVFAGRDKSQPNVLKISEIRWVYSAGAFLQYLLVSHHLTHEYPAIDTVWVRRDQFMPLLVLPAGGFNVRLFGDVIYQFGMTAPIRVEDADIDLSSYAISVGAQYVLLEVLANGTLNYVVGDLADSRAVLELGPLPTPSANAFPICAFEFYGGQTELRRDSTERTIIDLRMFTSDTSSGTGDQINAAPVGTLADAYYMGFWNTVANELQKITWSNVKATLKTYFDTLYSVLGHTHPLVDEDVQDIVGAMISGNSESGIDATYDDANGKLDFNVTIPAGHVHGLARWNGAISQTTFDLSDIWEYVDSVIINGVEEDPATYSLSTDGTQIVLDTALPDAYPVWANGVISQV